MNIRKNTRLCLRPDRQRGFRHPLASADFMVLPCGRHRPYRLTANHIRSDHPDFGAGLGSAYIREYYASEDKAALFKSFSLSPFVLSIVGGLLILLWNPSWPSEIIFDLNNTKLGILFLVFFTDHPVYPLFLAHPTDAGKSNCFLTQPADTEIPDFGFGFALHPNRLANPYHQPGLCLYRRPNTDRRCIDLPNPNRFGRRHPFALVGKAAQNGVAIRTAFGIRQSRLLGADVYRPFCFERNGKFGATGDLLDGGQLRRRRPDFPKRILNHMGAIGVQMG